MISTVHQPDFFVAGGTLGTDTPSYVERPADFELRAHSAAGALCYVLATRQMGKSSLMIHTAEYLQQAGQRTAIIDLTTIGAAPIEKWYLSLLDDLQTQLQLETDVEEWWQEHAGLTCVKRFTKFVHDVLLVEVNQPAVIFIDEVDAILKLDFSDDFFAALRALSNQFAVHPVDHPISFVLLGVAKPGDLIQDHARTPFNVGEQVRLEELRLEDACRVLAPGLPGESAAVLGRIFYWTNGHPYLTQKIGDAISKSDHARWGNKEIDDLVKQLFLNRQAFLEDRNLHFVRDRVLSSPNHEALLRLYHQVHRGQKIYSDERSPYQDELKLYGLVRVDEQGVLLVRNRIYEQVFDSQWVKEYLPQNWWSALPRPIKISAIIVLTLLIALMIVSFLAIRNARLAEERAQLALSRYLITQSLTLLDSHYEVALLLGLQAYQTADTPETEENLQYALTYNPYLTAYLRGHQEPVNNVLFSPDGRTLASASADKTIRLWDVNTWEQQGPPLTGHTHGVNTLAFSPNNAYLVSGGCRQYDEPQKVCRSGEVAFWNLAAELPRPRLITEHPGEVISLAFNADGRLLASSGGGRVVLSAGEPMAPVWRPTQAESGAAWALAFHPTDTSLLAVGTEDGRVVLLDAAGHAVRQTFPGHTDRIYSVAFSADGRFLATSSRDNTIRLWETATWLPVGEPLSGHASQVVSVAFSPDSQRLVSTSLDGQLIVWDIRTNGRLDLILTGHSGTARAAKFHPDPNRRLIASTGPQNSVILWNLAGNPERSRWLIRHSSAILGLDFSSDSSVLASAGDDHTITLWDVHTGAPIGLPLAGHTDAVRRVAFDPQGRYLASAGRDGQVILWRFTPEGIVPVPLSGHQAVVRSIAFSPGGEFLASSDDNGLIMLWNLRTEPPTGEPLQEQGSEVFDLDFSPDGSRIASGSWDGTVQLWDVASRQPVGEAWSVDMEQVWDVEFSPTDNLLAIAGLADHILLFDIAEQAVDYQVPTRQTGRINALAFSPDGKILASASSDNTIVRWHLLEQRFVGLPIRAHPSEVYALAFSADGRFLASGDLGGNMYLWTVKLATPQAQVCRLVGRNLTPEEWQQYLGIQEPYHESCSDLF